MMPAFLIPYGAATGRLCPHGCLRVRSRLHGDRGIYRSPPRPGSGHFAAGSTDAILMYCTTFIETIFLASSKRPTCTAHSHYKRLHLVSPPGPRSWSIFAMELYVRLHSNNHATCVGVGNVHGHETTAGSLLRWRHQPCQSGGQKDVVVKASDAMKPATYAAHKEAPSFAGVGRVTLKEICDGGGVRLGLWEVTHVRLSADWTDRWDPSTGAEPECKCRFKR